MRTTDYINTDVVAAPIEAWLGSAFRAIERRKKGDENVSAPGQPTHYLLLATRYFFSLLATRYPLLTPRH
jgi:hypothetical protein